MLGAMNGKARLTPFMGAVLILFSLFLSSCSPLIGWGVLVWSADSPFIPSGTVLPVYIKSNIDHVWVVEIPKEYKNENSKIDKVELPLWKLKYFNNQRKAAEWAKQFAELASVYGETMQDGLPLRSEPDNNARRVYRLHGGQIVKILERVKGTPTMSGDTPLPGEWFKVLTDDGSEGYCFSYRLRLFKNTDGKLGSTRVNTVKPQDDPVLDSVLGKIWSPDWYKDMVDSHRIDLDNFADTWGFFPSPDTGTIQISLPKLNKSYTYTRIVAAGENSWRFDGSPVQMTLRSNNLLAVQYTDSNGEPKTLLFTTLAAKVGDLISQETERRVSLFQALFQKGPVFKSDNYGNLTFTPDGRFTWTDNTLLVPSVIPVGAQGSGTVYMRLFLGNSLMDQYDGAFSLRFDRVSSPSSGNSATAGSPQGAAPLQGGADGSLSVAPGASAGGTSTPGASTTGTSVAGTPIPPSSTPGVPSVPLTSSDMVVNFLYKIENSGLRIEYAPRSVLEGTVVTHRSPSPLVIYFTPTER